MLEFDPPELQFQHVKLHKKYVATVTIHNTSSTAVSCTLKPGAAGRYSVAPEELRIDGGKSVEAVVTLKVTHFANRAKGEAGQRDFIFLKSELWEKKLPVVFFLAPEPAGVGKPARAVLPPPPPTAAAEPSGPPRITELQRASITGPLRARIAELEQQLSAATAAAATAPPQNVQGLLARIAEIEHDHAVLTAQHARDSQELDRLRDLEMEWRRSSPNVAGLIDAAVARERAAVEERSQKVLDILQRKDATIAKQKESIAELEHELHAARVTSEELAQQLDAATNELTHAQDIEQELERVRQINSSLLAEVDRLTNIVRDIQESHTQPQQQQPTIGGRFNDEGQAESDLVSRLKARIMEQAEQIDVLVSEVATGRAQHAFDHNLHQRVQELEDENRLLRSGAPVYEHRHRHSYSSSTADATAQAAGAATVVTPVKPPATTPVAASELARAEARVTDLQQQLARSKQDAAQLASQSQQLQQQLTASRQEVAQLRATVDIERAQLAQIQQRATQLEAMHQSVRLAALDSEEKLVRALQQLQSSGATTRPAPPAAPTAAPALASGPVGGPSRGPAAATAPAASRPKKSGAGSSSALQDELQRTMAELRDARERIAQAESLAASATASAAEANQQLQRLQAQHHAETARMSQQLYEMASRPLAPATTASERVSDPVLAALPPQIQTVIEEQDRELNRLRQETIRGDSEMRARLRSLERQVAEKDALLAELQSNLASQQENGSVRLAQLEDTIRVLRGRGELSAHYAAARSDLQAAILERKKATAMAQVAAAREAAACRARDKAIAEAEDANRRLAALEVQMAHGPLIDHAEVQQVTDLKLKCAQLEDQVTLLQRRVHETQEESRLALQSAEQAAHTATGAELLPVPVLQQLQHSRITALERELADRNREIANLRSQQDLLNDAHAQRLLLVHSQHAQQAGLLSSSAAKSTMQAELLRMERDFAVARVSALEAQGSTTTRVWQDKCSQLELTISQLRSQLGEAASLHQAANRETERLQTLLTERNAQTAALVDTLHALQSAAAESSELQAVYDRCLALTSQLTTAHAVESSLRRKLADVEHQLDDSAADREVLTRQVHTLQDRLVADAAGEAAEQAHQSNLHARVEELERTLQQANLQIKELDMQLNESIRQTSLASQARDSLQAAVDKASKRHVIEMERREAEHVAALARVQSQTTVPGTASDDATSGTAALAKLVKLVSETDNPSSLDLVHRLGMMVIQLDSAVTPARIAASEKQLEHARLDVERASTAPTSPATSTVVADSEHKALCHQHCESQIELLRQSLEASNQLSVSLSEALATSEAATELAQHRCQELRQQAEAVQTAASAAAMAKVDEFVSNLNTSLKEQEAGLKQWIVGIIDASGQIHGTGLQLQPALERVATELAGRISSGYSAQQVVAARLEAAELKLEAANDANRQLRLLLKQTQATDMSAEAFPKMSQMAGLLAAASKEKQELTAMLQQSTGQAATLTVAAQQHADQLALVKTALSEAQLQAQQAEEQFRTRMQAFKAESEATKQAAVQQSVQEAQVPLLLRVTELTELLAVQAAEARDTHAKDVADKQRLVSSLLTVYHTLEPAGRAGVDQSIDAVIGAVEQALPQVPVLRDRVAQLQASAPREQSSPGDSATAAEQPTRIPVRSASVPPSRRRQSGGSSVEDSGSVTSVHKYLQTVKRRKSDTSVASDMAAAQAEVEATSSIAELREKLLKRTMEALQLRRQLQRFSEGTPAADDSLNGNEYPDQQAMEHMAQRLVAAEAHVKELRGQLAQTEAQLAAARAPPKHAKLPSEALRLKELEQHGKMLSGQLQATTQELSEAKQIAQEAVQEVQRLSSENRALRESAAAAGNKPSGGRSDKAATVASIATSGGSGEGVSTGTQTVLRLVPEQQLQDANQKLEELSAILNVTDTNGIVDCIQRLQRSAAASQTEVIRARSEMQSLHERLRNAESEMGAARKQMEDAQTTISQLTESCSQLSRQLTVAKSDAAAAATVVPPAVEAKLEQLSSALSTMSALRTTEQADAGRQLEQLTTAYNQLMESSRTMISPTVYAESQAALYAAERTIENAEKQVQRLTEDHAAKVAELAQAEHKYQQAQMALAAAHEALQRSETAADELQGRVNEVEQELRSTIVERDAARASEAAQLAKHQKRYAAVSAEKDAALAAVQSEVQALRERVTRHLSGKAAAKRGRGRSRSVEPGASADDSGSEGDGVGLKHSTKTGTKVRPGRRSVPSGRPTKRSKSRGAASGRAPRARSSDVSDAEVSGYDSDDVMGHGAEAIVIMETKLAAVEMDLQLCQADLKTANQRSASLQQDVQRLTAELTAARSDLAESEQRLQDTKRDAKEAVKAAHRDVERLNSQLKMMKDHWKPEAELVRVQTELQAATLALKSAKDEASRKSRQLSSAQEQVQQLSAAVHEQERVAQAAVAAASSRGQAESTSLAGRVKKLEQQVADKEAVIATLRNRLDVVLGEYEAEKESTAALQHKLAVAQSDKAARATSMTALKEKVTKLESELAETKTKDMEIEKLDDEVKKLRKEVGRKDLYIRSMRAGPATASGAEGRAGTETPPRSTSRPRSAAGVPADQNRDAVHQLHEMLTSLLTIVLEECGKAHMEFLLLRDKRRQARPAMDGPRESETTTMPIASLLNVSVAEARNLLTSLDMSTASVLTHDGDAHGGPDDFEGYRQSMLHTLQTALLSQRVWDAQRVVLDAFHQCTNLEHLLWMCMENGKGSHETAAPRRPVSRPTDASSSSDSSSGSDQTAHLRESLLKYEALVNAVKAELLSEHAASQSAMARYEHVIESLQYQLGHK